jgi:hypothetical protein
MRGLKTKRPTLVFCLAPKKLLQSYGEAITHQQYSVIYEKRDDRSEPITAVVATGRRDKYDRKQNS